jgi:phage tail sheath protein FI
MTPGVYLEEKNAFPSSAVAVETAVPAFIGYTALAERNGKSLAGRPTRITSFAEYVECFGGGFKAKFTVEKASDTDRETFTADGEQKTVVIAKNNTAYMFNSIRLFYANGGGPCYILSVGQYAGADTLEIKASDFDALDELDKQFEPTLVVVPDAIALGNEAYGIYQKILAHCAKMQSRFGIFDLVKQEPTEETNDVVNAFREAIGINFLNYGAAYYPWLDTTVVAPEEIDFENIDGDLAALLPETDAKKIIAKYNADRGKLDPELEKLIKDKEAALKGGDPIVIIEADKAVDDKTQDIVTAKKHFNQGLKAVSLTYVNILAEIRNKLNQLPPSGAIAGIYTMVDNSRGVWKAPANVSVNMVTAPSVNISAEAQQSLNVDVMAGKSINVIRTFPGIGSLVWGGRTLDGNSQDWRYINVRRTLIMIEQSIKLAARAYVFEPNDANTWVTVKSMIENFLVNLWRQGALAGAAPEQAYDVQIGLGATMTPTDILDGKMLISVKVALVRPAEFIVITFQQQMQQS